MCSSDYTGGKKKEKHGRQIIYVHIFLFLKKKKNQKQHQYLSSISMNRMLQLEYARNVMTFFSIEKKGRNERTITCFSMVYIKDGRVMKL